MNTRFNALRGTVLVVDDTTSSSDLLRDVLEEAGYGVVVAMNGSAALVQVEHFRPDAILLDVVMPGLDGFEVCQRLQSSARTADVPVLFITALSAAMDIERAFGEGAVDYIVKPINERELLARLSAHIGKSRHARRAEASMRALGSRAVMCRVDGTLTWATGTARAILEDWLDLRLVEGLRLPTRIIEWMDNQAAHIKDAHCGLPCLRIETHAGLLHIHDAGGALDDERLLVLEPQPSGGPGRLEAAFGLTVREAEVLGWVARGKTNRDIGEILGLSPRTVNKHLEHVFAKLGVETRTAATALALPLLGGPS
jgi:DNA-binding NarL/FixJ family response regulator